MMARYASTHPFNLAVLISGNGSNLQAIIDALPHMPARISTVLSDRADALGLVRAKHANIPTQILLKKDFANRHSYDVALRDYLAPYQPNLIVLAGFMHMLSGVFVRHFQDQIINLHPALLPKYPGLYTHQRALLEKEPVCGATVHVVTEALDAGPIIMRAMRTISQNDTEEHLCKKVQVLEHALYPTVIRLYAHNRLHVSCNTVYLDGGALPAWGLNWNTFTESFPLATDHCNTL